MDVVFEPQKGTAFTIEIGFFDSVLEIKEKVQKYQGIPIPKQTLIFNGHVLQDDHDVERCTLLHNSHVHLLVAPDSDIKQAATTEELSPSMKKIQLSLKIPSLSKMQLPVEIEANDSVLKLKEKLQEMEGIPVNNVVLKDATGAELQDHKSLNEYHEVIDGSEIHVGFKTLPSGSSSAMPTSTTAAATTSTTAAVSAGAGGTKKLKLFVLPMGGTKKIPVEMNANDNVGELRKELQKLQEKLQFRIPQEGYFFIYKQNVMDDDRSFRWHHVSNGETIEIFNGSISGGS